ncbi:MAG: hypothetical protein ACREU6_04590 [Steroidobacteraceae bacterium]
MIPGALDMTALALLSGSRDDRRMQHWHTLSHAAQRAVVLRMADGGQSDVAIACATGWSREYVAHVIGERRERRA